MSLNNTLRNSWLVYSCKFPVMLTDGRRCTSADEVLYLQLRSQRRTGQSSRTATINWLVIIYQTGSASVKWLFPFFFTPLSYLRTSPWALGNTDRCFSTFSDMLQTRSWIWETVKSLFKKSSTEIWRINLVSVPKNLLADLSILCDNPSLCNMRQNISSKASSFIQNSVALSFLPKLRPFFPNLSSRINVAHWVQYFTYSICCEKFTIRDTRERRLEQWRRFCGSLASWTKTKIIILLPSNPENKTGPREFHLWNLPDCFQVYFKMLEIQFDVCR